MQQQDKPTNQRMVYAVDGKRYDVHSLPVEAQQALKLMLEVDKKLPITIHGIIYIPGKITTGICYHNDFP